MPARLAANSRSSIAGRAPAATAACTCARTASAAALRTSGPRVVAGSVGSPSRYWRMSSMQPRVKGSYTRLVHVDALHPAARLAGVEDRRRPRCSRWRGRGRHRARTYTGSQPPSSSPTPMKRSAAALLHRAAAGHRAGEGDEVDARIADHALGVLVREVQHLEDAVRQAGGAAGTRQNAPRTAASAPSA